MKNRKIHNETKLPRLLNPINTIFRVSIFNTFIMRRFIRINEAEYSTDFDFFMCHQVHVIQHLDDTTSFCSLLEKRCFKKDSTHSLGDNAIMYNIRQIHLDIISLKYGGELIF
jgi:hypothetical protein